MSLSYCMKRTAIVWFDRYQYEKVTKSVIKQCVINVYIYVFEQIIFYLKYLDVLSTGGRILRNKVASLLARLAVSIRQ